MTLFNESEWLKLIFLLADTQAWIDDLTLQALKRLPVHDKKKFLQKSYYLGIKPLAHILERHYHKINRYPHAGKFNIPVTEILHHIREAHAVPPVPNGNNFQRTVHTTQAVGFDKSGQSTNIITILTDAGGRIITAFPGTNEESCFPGTITPLADPYPVVGISTTV